VTEVWWDDKEVLWVSEVFTEDLPVHGFFLWWQWAYEHRNYCIVALLTEITSLFLKIPSSRQQFHQIEWWELCYWIKKHMELFNFFSFNASFSTMKVVYLFLSIRAKLSITNQNSVVST